jgi:hypothetical protein
MLSLKLVETTLYLYIDFDLDVGVDPVVDGDDDECCH